MPRFLFLVRADDDVRIAVSAEFSSLKEVQDEADRLLGIVMQDEKIRQNAVCICNVRVTDPTHRVVYLAKLPCDTCGT